ncbi:MAG TPA: ATP-grasp domain-containing protein, partial [Terriglobales bacterium]|nr:ATP-grasp domain-containing protein [Terriglobales bacterium]
MKILVTDGRQRSTLAVVRSLGRSRFKVIVGESVQPCLASASRYCSGQLVYPDPLIDPERFKAFILQELRSGYFGVLAITDIAAQLLASIESELPPGVKLLSASRKPLQCVQDKAVTLLLARNAGIAVPESHHPCDFQELLELSEHLTYPVVIKPRYSHFWSGDHWAHGRVCYAHSKEELLSKYWRAHSLIRGPIVQRYVQGQGRGIFVLLWKDQLMAAFAHRRLREHPPTGGVGVLCSSEPMDEILLLQSVRLLRSIGWSGPAMVEYKDDIADGIPKLMEVNGRFWGSLQLATNAGVNFPLTLC